MSGDMTGAGTGDMRYDTEATYVVVLECGFTFNWYDHTGHDVPQVGWYFDCPDHSPLTGYDPVTGDGEHERDKQVIRVSRVDIGGPT